MFTFSVQLYATQFIVQQVVMSSDSLVSWYFIGSRTARVTEIVVQVFNATLIGERQVKML